MTERGNDDMAERNQNLEARVKLLEKQLAEKEKNMKRKDIDKVRNLLGNVTKSVRPCYNAIDAADWETRMESTLSCASEILNTTSGAINDFGGGGRGSNDLLIGGAVVGGILAIIGFLVIMNK